MSNHKGALNPSVYQRDVMALNKLFGDMWILLGKKSVKNGFWKGTSNQSCEKNVVMSQVQYILHGIK